MGQAQQRVGLSQDPEAAFGQASVSKELPAKIQMRNVRGGDDFVAHAMFVPAAGSNYGRYYEIASDGTPTAKCSYNDWYFSSAEYFEGGERPWPVYAFSNDHTVGYSNLNYGNGTVDRIAAVGLNMNEITYDYNHDRMLGTKYGYIYEINENGSVNEPLYDYNEHGGIQPIAMAADLDGTLYFVALSAEGETAKLYKFLASDEDLTTPIEIGDLGYEARKIQTMAFNHASKHRELYWWQCQENGDTRFLEINKEDATTTPVAVDDAGAPLVMNTEMAGLFFEFAYVDHTVYCIDDENALSLHDSQIATSIANDYRSALYLPGKNVNVTIDVPNCMTLDSIVVYCKDDGDILYTSGVIGGVTINGSIATFPMVAMDVQVDAMFTKNMHEIEYTWTPATLTGAITGPSTGLCGNTITINYGHPEGYILIQNSLTVNGSSAVNVNPSSYQASFVMPDEDVAVNAQFGTIAVAQLSNICQYHKYASAPTFNKPSNLSSYSYVYELYNPTAGSTPTVTLSASEFNTYEFTVAGNWRYRIKVTNMYGVFYTAYKTFKVCPAPRSIAITGNQYNCEGGEINLTVVPTPSTTFPTGTFTWMKDGVVLTTTTTPNLVITNAQRSDAGVYNVTFETTECGCEIVADDTRMINVASLPNQPQVSVVGHADSTICFNSQATLQWEYGYLFPDEYNLQWYTVDNTGEWHAISGATAMQYTTNALIANAQYGLEIRYAGDYNECFNRSEIFTVKVREDSEIEMGEPLSTCMLIYPDSSLWPILDPAEYSAFTWYFDGEELGETSNKLHMDNVELNGNMVAEVGIHTIEVAAVNGTECDAHGILTFEVLPLPGLEISNSINDEIATPGPENAVTLTVCAGTPITLTASGADSYDWGDYNSSASSILVNPTSNKVYICTGTNDATGCWNTAYVFVNVIPRPTVEWVHPANDTTLSMMTGCGIVDVENLMMAPGTPDMLNPIQLEATPAGGIFTYVIEGDPTNTVFPIKDGILNPSELGIGDYQLIYSYSDENGCTNEERIIKIHIVKPYWTDKGVYDSVWFENCQAAGRYEISNPHELGAYAATLRGMYGPAYDFEGDTIYITDNINLLEKPYFYRTVNGFKGVFDGNGKIVYNTVLLEDALDLNIDGTIRNLGVVDANFTSAKVTNKVRVNGDVLNSFVTKPVLNNVEPYLGSKGHISNVYYVGDIKGEQSSIWYDNMCTPRRMIMPVEVPQLLGDSTIELTNFNVLADPYYTYDGELENWVWLKNDFTYMFWTHDYEGNVNHGWPYMTSHFIHHHFVELVYDNEVVDANLGNTRIRTIQDTDYEYALNYDVVNITVEEEPYMVIDSVYAQLVYPDATEVNINIDEVSDLYYEYTLPADSLYDPAYDVVFHVVAHRDFWTDAPNYDANWYTNNFGGITGNHSINNPAELAALAWECDFNGHDFEGDTIFINGSGNGESWVMNMSAHAWEPIYNFKGVLDGTHFLVEGLFVASRDIVARPQLAMFVNESSSSKRDEEPEEESEEINLYDGEASDYYVPFYGYFADANAHSEWIVPAEDLTDMVGKQIDAVTFYVATLDINEDVVWELYMMPTEMANFNDEAGEINEPTKETGDDEEEIWTVPEGATLVYTGGIDVANRYFTLEFDTPYVYNGGNIYFCSRNINSDGTTYYDNVTFAGIETENVTYSAGYYYDDDEEEEIEEEEQYEKGGAKASAWKKYGMFLPKMTLRIKDAPETTEGVIRNFILKDVAYMNGAENIATLVNGGNMTVYNSAVTYDPTLGQHIEIAVYGEGQKVNVINTYTLDEGGMMITQEHNPIEFDDLRAWVANTNEPYYWDWKLDEQPYINYNYPIHSNAWVPGLIITYIPSLEAQNHGYLDGPATALQGETVCVESYPATGYELTKLLVDGVDILPELCFEMPDHDVVVEGEFDPINWNYNIIYVFEDEANPTSSDVLPTPNPEHHTFIYGEIDTIIPPVVEGFEPDPDTLFVNMPNGDVTITVTYYGVKHNVNACEFADAEYATFSTNSPAEGNAPVDVITEGFEGGVMPTGWTCEGSNTWEVGKGDKYTSTGSASGEYNALITHYYTGTKTYLVTPMMNLSAATEGHVTFNMVNRMWVTDTDELGVYYRVNGGTWNQLYYTAAAHSSWTEVTVDLEGFADNYQLGFMCYDQYGYGIGLDDIVVNANVGGNTIGTVRNTHDVEITITPREGYTIVHPELIQIIANDGFDTPVDVIAERYEGTSLILTVRMPNYDITVEACDPMIYGEIYWTDYGIRDISWYVGHEDETTFTLTTDSMLGGLSALVNGLCDVEDGEFEYSNGVYPHIDFSGCTIILESAQEPNEINLVEHLWRPIGAQVDEKWGFEGYFNGNGVKITHMKTSEYFENLHQPGACQALFGNVGMEGVVNNVDVAGNANGRYFTAGIVAINNGMLINSVSHVNVYSEFEAGGIVSVNKGEVYNCYCDADSVECYSAMPVKDGAHNYYVGGIAALNQGMIMNCHSVAPLKYGIDGHNPINFYGGAIGVNEAEGEFLFWRNITNGVGNGEAITASEVMTTSNYSTIANKMNTKAGNIECDYALYGWKTVSGCNYPVFSEMIENDILNSNDNEINVVLYPNPTKGLVRIITENIQNVTVYNMFGQQVLNHEVEGNETSIDMNGFAAGIYMVRITTNEGVAVKNVIVEK